MHPPQQNYSLSYYRGLRMGLMNVVIPVLACENEDGLYDENLVVALKTLKLADINNLIKKYANVEEQKSNLEKIINYLDFLQREPDKEQILSESDFEKKFSRIIHCIF